MATLPLDLKRLAAEATEADDDEAGTPASTRIGHVHLNVADLERAEAFYCELLGFDVTTRGFPGPSSWPRAAITTTSASTRGWARRPPAAAGGARLEPLRARGRRPDRARGPSGTSHPGGVRSDPVADGVLIRDPSANGVLLRTR